MMSLKKALLGAAASAWILAGCGGSESERMSAYIRGYMDLTYKGELNDDYAEMMDISEEEAQQQYEDGLMVEVEFFTDNIAIIEYPTDEINQKIRDLYAEIYSHSDYTVGSGSLLDSGSYAVEVSIRPIDIMTRFTSDDFNTVFTDILAAHGVTDEVALYNLSQEEYETIDHEYAEKIIEMISAEVDSIGYTEEKNIAVQIRDGGEMWEPVDDDISQIDTWIIDYSTFGYY